MSRAGRYLRSCDADHWSCAGDRAVDVLPSVWVVGNDGGLVFGGCCGGEREDVVKTSGEVAFEAAQRGFLGFAFGLFAREVGLGGWVVAGAGDRDRVERSVELAVPAAVEPELAALA